MDLLRLVNRTHLLHENYIPKGLVCDEQTQVKLYKKAYYQFQKINVKMKKMGMEPLVLVSGYRSYIRQTYLFSKKVKFFLEQGYAMEEAHEKAAQIVALPGSSEHQLGLAMDVTTKKMALLEDPLITSFEETKEGQWLKQYAAYFGFILRYPKDKVALTQITYEPWHYRYVGKRHALKMTRLGLCLEEYCKK